MASIADIRFSSCAYFYKLKEGEKFTDSQIKRMLITVTSDKQKDFLYDECRQAGPNGTKYSLRVFKDRPKTPSFLQVDEKSWKEVKIGYFLFIEYENYVAIVRKNCTVPKDVASKLEPISYDELISLHAKDSTEFKRISMQNLDGSDHAMRYKAYESLNLQENLSPIGTNRYSIRTVKGNNGDDRFALTLYASRINEFKSDLTVSDLCGWVKTTSDTINGIAGNNSSFLKIFAKPESYSLVYKTLEPSSLLIFYGLIMSIHDNPNVVFKHKGVPIENGLFYRYIGILSRCYENVVVIDDGEKRHYYTGLCNGIEIILDKTRIKLKNKTWNNITIEGSDDEEYDGTLSSLINTNNLFNVYFRDEELIYSNRTLFRDTRLMESVPHFLDILKAVVPKTFDCEKHIGPFNKGLTCWGANSIFKYVESTFASSYKYFICDDCDEEWADHIGISSGKVTFFIEKHKGSLDSASDFQDVVAQALKNIANLMPLPHQLNGKRDSWNDSYRGSTIKRMVTAGVSVDDAIAEWKANNIRPNCRREMCLVVDFLSKDRFARQLEDIQKGIAIQYESETRQRLWMLSSFVMSCLESHVTPLIYCLR